MIEHSHFCTETWKESMVWKERSKHISPGSRAKNNRLCSVHYHQYCEWKRNVREPIGNFQGSCYFKTRQKHNLLTGFLVHGMEFQSKMRETIIVFMLKGSLCLHIFQVSIHDIEQWKVLFSTIYSWKWAHLKNFL